jgi:hypothetical protein
MFAEEIKPEPLSFHIPALNNLDFTKKGQQATTGSWVVSNLDIIPQDELKTVGRLVADPAMWISQDKLELQALIVATKPTSHPANRFLIHKKYDFEVYTFTMQRHAQTAMGLQLPAYEEARHIIPMESFDGDYIPFP